MKKFFLLSLFTCFTFLSLVAQRSLPEIYETAEELNLRYQFDEEQQVEVVRILENRVKNMEEIEELRNSNEPIYWMKRKAIYLGEQGSIRMILNTEAQIAAHSQVRRELRLAESNLIKGYLADGKSKAEARQLLLQNKY
ncbi:hypothetical protein CEQ90_03495 [Lewinellaceae bacterium SD302]|nr:hypothetical protein CEQ90_03495 [Lewinellaceae bacterium SD302]